MFDLTLLPLNFTADQENSELPGLAVAAPPHRTARGRAGDQLIQMLTLTGTAPLTPAEIDALLSRLAKKYYQTPGSVTAAMRKIADELNQYLLERNLRNTSAGKQSLGLYNLAVLHSNLLYVTHCGPTHTFILTADGVQHLFDPQTSGRGLGLSRVTSLRYYQAEIQENDGILLSPEPPATWNANNLAGSTALSIDALRRRLLNQRPATLRGAFLQCKPGTGKVISSRSRVAPSAEPPIPNANPLPTSPAPVAQPAPVFQATVATHPVPDALEKRVQPAAVPAIHPVPIQQTPPWEDPSVEEPRAVEAAVEETAVERETIHPIAQSNLDPEEEQPVSTRPTPTAAATPTRQPDPAPEKLKTARPEPRSKIENPLRPFLARMVQSIAGMRQKAAQALSTFLPRLLPNHDDQPAGLSPASAIFIAVAVPLVVVTMSSVVYLQKGRARQYQDYFLQAQTAAAQAQGQSDPTLLRDQWGKSLLYLDKAESYQITDESQSLRQQAQGAIDNLDSITRMDFQPAINGGLAASVKISRMVATASDLYMLDSSQGRVLRAVLTGHGYEVDSSFHCEPGKSGGYIIGSLIDISPLPRDNEFKATVMALDGSGNMLYCIPNEASLSAPLATPDQGWGEIRAFTYDSSKLYVLDPKTNAVWVYEGGDGAFSDRPRLFFDKVVPDLSDVIDLAVNSDDLYLLHEDGHLTLCTLSTVSITPTRCTDPAPYSDMRAGREGSSATIADTQFKQIMYTQPPDPSIYMLDASNASIYHFSLRLNLQRQLRAQSDAYTEIPTQGATAFTINTNRMSFLAFGNQVYYALIP